MTDRYFLDTNVFVYELDRTNTRKQKLATELVERTLALRGGIVSYQVVQEFLSVALRKFPNTLSAADARTYMDTVLMPICEIFPDSALFSDAISIAEQTGWRFYDSLIVASAARAKCKVLFSEDLQVGRKIRGVEIRNPFA